MKKRLVFYDAYLNESGVKGGSCSSLFKLIKGFREQSEHEITLLSNTTNNPLISNYQKLGVEIISNKYLHRLIIYGRSEGLTKKLLKYSIFAIAANFWFISFLRHKQPDIVIYNDQRASSTFFLANLLIQGKHRIISIIRSTKETKSVFNRVSYRLSNTLITVSGSVLNRLPKRSQKKAAVIHNGIEIRNLPKEPRRDNSIHLITVANIARYKGLDLVLKSISAFPTDLQNRIEYHIVGAIKDTSYYEGLTALYNDLNSKFKLTFEGQQEDVYKFLNWSDIFILPSREEGFGLVLLEAMDCSLPLIGSRVGGIPEIIKEEYNGLIFEKNDHKDLQGKLYRLIDDLDLRAEFAENSKTHVNTFSIDQTVQRYLNIL